MREHEQKPQRIFYPNNPVMAAAFAGMIRFAAFEPTILDQFHHATGIMPFWTARRGPIDSLIDNATGREIADFEAFVNWIIETHWGEDPFAVEDENV